MREVIFNEDLFPKLIQYIESPHAAIFMRINRLQRSQLDKVIYRRLIQEEHVKLCQIDLIVSGSSDKNVKIWDTNGVCLKTLQGHTRGVNSVAFNPDGAMVVSASDDGTIKIWGTKTGECLKTIDSQAKVKSVTYNPEGSLIVSAGNDCNLKIWDAYTGEMLKILRGHDQRINSAAFNPDGSMIVSASDDGTIKIWDAETGQCLKTLDDHNQIVNSAVFDSYGSLIVSASDDGTMKIQDATTGNCLNTIEDYCFINSAALNPEGSLIVSAGVNDELKIQDSHTGKHLKTLKGHTSDVNSIKFNPDGSMIISTSYDRTLKIWDARTGKCLKTLRGHARNVSSAVFLDISKYQTMKNSFDEIIYSVKKKGDNLFRGKMFLYAINKQLECLSIISDGIESAVVKIRIELHNSIAFCQFNLFNQKDSLYQAEKAIVYDKLNQDAQNIICNSLYNLGMLREAYQRITSFLIDNAYNTDLIVLKDQILNQLQTDINNKINIKENCKNILN